MSNIHEEFKEDQLISQLRESLSNTLGDLDDSVMTIHTGDYEVVKSLNYNDQDIPIIGFEGIIEGKNAVLAVVIGNTLILRQSISETISRDLKMMFANVIIMNNLKDPYTDINENVYSALTTAAIGVTDVKGMTVTDLGSGSGIQSLQAAERGATKVYAIDLPSDAVFRGASAEEMIKSGWIANKDKINTELTYRNADINSGRDREKILQCLEKSDLAVFNLGPHYGDTDLNVLELLRAIKLVGGMKKLRTLILGGYMKGDEDTPEELKWLDYKRVTTSLTELGFSKLELVTSPQGYCSIIAKRVD